MLMKNETYDILKNVAYILPALATLVLSVGGIWSIPYSEAVAGTITAVETFLCALLKISSVKYQQSEDPEA